MNTKLATKHWQDPLNVILGLWMAASPWLLAYSGEQAAMWNAVIFGLIIAGAELTALFRVMAWEEWASFAIGIWLAISPWVLGFNSIAAATWNAVIVGLVVAALAMWALGTDRDIGGWWSPTT